MSPRAHLGKSLLWASPLIPSAGTVAVALRLATHSQSLLLVTVEVPQCYTWYSPSPSLFPSQHNLLLSVAVFIICLCTQPPTNL